MWLTNGVYDLGEANGGLKCIQNGLAGMLCILNGELPVVPCFFCLPDCICTITLVLLFHQKKVYLSSMMSGVGDFCVVIFSLLRVFFLCFIKLDTLGSMKVPRFLKKKLTSFFLYFWRQNDYVHSDQQAFYYLEKAVDQVRYLMEGGSCHNFRMNDNLTGLCCVLVASRCSLSSGCCIFDRRLC